MNVFTSLATMAFAGLMVLGASGNPEGADETILRRVAGAVVKQTSRQLVDSRTDRTFTASEELVPAPEIRIESKFNAWFYQTWLLADGMRRTAGVLDEPALLNYGERNLDFIFQHMAFFGKQHAAGMRMAPVGDGKLSPIGFYFKIDALWHTGLAPLVMERYAETKDPRYEPYLKLLTEFLETCPRFEDGAFYRTGKGMMTDDPFMTVPFLLRRWQAGGDARDLDKAIAQILGTHDRLFDRERGLLRHLWDLKTKQPAGVFWGRGNGWMVLAHAELLATMPREHPRRGEALAAFERHMEGIRRCQDPAGGWHQVLDHPESWIETSCTGMFIYGLARGVNEGWLDASFREAASKGWEALKTKITADGDLVDVCGSTDVGDLTFYLNRPRLQGDLHGFGSFLLAGAEIIRMRTAASDRILSKLPADVKVTHPVGSPLKDALLPVPETAIFKMDGYYLWDPSVIKVGDLYHLFASRWPVTAERMKGWTKSHVIRATSKSLFGPYQFQEVVLSPATHPWATQAVHNPKVMKTGGKFLIYHLGIPQWKTGFAYADSIEGPWTPVPQPVLATNNPAIIERADGSAYAVGKFKPKEFKDGKWDACMQAFEADTIDGPYKVLGGPSNRLPYDFELEDPTLWWAGDRYNVICTDWEAKVTGIEKAVVYYTSKNGVDYELDSRIPVWSQADPVPLANGKSMKISGVERPQVFLDERGAVIALLASVYPADREKESTFIVIRPVDRFFPGN